MRVEEEFCRKCFDSYLKERLGLHTAWWAGPGPNEPPDYFVRVAGTTFAVEVTQLFGEVQTDRGAPMGDEQYEASMMRVCEQIREAAIQQGILRGLYLIHFVGPFEQFGRARRVIIRRALEYIRVKQGATRAMGQVVFAETAERMKQRGFSPEMIVEAVSDQLMQGSCSIAKLGGSPDAIDCVTSARGRCMYEGQVLAEACRMLQKALSEKERKLARIAGAKILLLLHQWPMQRAWIYRDCVRGLTFLDRFHSIFVVETEDEGYFLYTEEPQWRTPTSTCGVDGNSDV